MGYVYMFCSPEGEVDHPQCIAEYICFSIASLDADRVGLSKDIWMAKVCKFLSTLDV